MGKHAEMFKFLPQKQIKMKKKLLCLVYKLNFQYARRFLAKMENGTYILEKSKQELKRILLCGLMMISSPIQTIKII